MSIRKEQIIEGSGYFSTVRELYSADDQVEWYPHAQIDYPEVLDKEDDVTTIYTFEDTSFNPYKGWIAKEFIPARESTVGKNSKLIMPELVVFSIQGLEDTTIEMSATKAVECGLLGSISAVTSRPISMTDYSFQTLERKLNGNGFH